MIRIVDYGVGNVQAFLTAFKRIGVEAERARTPDQVLKASKLILPGVGHFDQAMGLLNLSGIRSVLEHKVLNEGVPVLGVCVGMQMLAGSSEEGTIDGLNWIPGRVRAFPVDRSIFELPSPHMGWNDLCSVNVKNKLLARFSYLPRFYFLHSYYFEAETRSDVIAEADYGIRFCAVVARGNIYGVQFHPEKSHDWGVQLFKNFADL